MANTERGQKDHPWEWIGTWQWQHFAVVALALAGFVALSFVPLCSVHISTGNTTTTTEAR